MPAEPTPPDRTTTRVPWPTALGARLAALYLDLAHRTTRWRLDERGPGFDALRAAPAVVAFWHEAIPLTPALLARLRAEADPVAAGRKVHALISRHRDGALATRIVGRFGIETVRGSAGRRKQGRLTDRGGAAALRQMRSMLAQGGHVAIAGDGPRGPARRLQPGVAVLAGLAGAPIVPCGFATRPSLRLGGWDRMRLPVPFGHGRIVIGAPIAVSREAAAGASEAVAAALDRLQEAADATGRVPPGARACALAWAVLATLAAPGLRVVLQRRLRRGKEIRGRLAERRGCGGPARPDGRLVWVHAASVGETLAIAPVLDALAERDDAVSILLTTGTATSARLLEPWLDATERRRARIRHRMAPLDVPAWVRRFLEHWRPDAAVFVESELWPNQLAQLRRRGVPVALVNARLSDGSARAWSRVPGFARHLLGGLDPIVARSAEDADRLRALGGRIRSVGDLKRAAPPLEADPALLERLRSRIGARPCLVAASTHPGEEEVVAEAHRRLARRFPDLLTIVVPRHPSRGASVAQALDDAPRRALDQEPDPAHGFWVLDQLGELGLAYRLATIAFVGRSLPGLSARGGQNPLEPARLGCAVATGPRTGNFRDAVAALRDADALTVVDDAAALADWAALMLGCPARAVAAGARGRAVASSGAALIGSLADLIGEMGARAG